MIHTRISSLGIEIRCSDADFRREAKRIDTEIVAAKILIQGLQASYREDAYLPVVQILES